jgi:predicted metalloprotease
MRWRGRRKSSNVEDRRNMQASGIGGMRGGGGLLRLLPMVFKFLGFKGTLILVTCVGAYGLLSGNLGEYVSCSWCATGCTNQYVFGTTSGDCRRASAS